MEAVSGLDAMTMYCSPPSASAVAGSPPVGVAGIMMVTGVSVTGVTTVSVLSPVCLLTMLMSMIARLGGGRLGGA